LVDAGCRRGVCCDEFHPLDARALWADLQAVRAHAPLVHSITNLVVMNFNANALLAVGASPVMAHAHEEVRDMVGIAQALVLNIGTLEPAWISAMQVALQAARARGIPVVLDPVGAGATPYRNAALAELIRAGAPGILRGNASEIMSVAGLAAATRGVDSAASTADASDAAAALARQLGAVVCVSGADDLVVDAAGRRAVLSNGHPWMTGSPASAARRARWWAPSPRCSPTRGGPPWRRWRCWGGRRAGRRARPGGGAGVGRLQIELLDGLQLLDEASFTGRLRMVVDA
jgi:hydroxyethylthiazole kinase